MKSIWVFILSAATVTAYLHVKHQEPILQPMKHHEFTPLESASATPAAREIVVAPFNPGEVGARFQEHSSTPDSSVQKRWDN